MGALAIGIAFTPVAGTLALTAAIGILVAGLPDMVYTPISTYLQHNTEADYRATTLSIAESAFSVQMLWMFPLAGVLIERVGWTAAYAVDGALLALAAALVICSQWLPGREREDAAAEARPEPAAT